ncbi:hypothetical protein QBC35DRAFT_490143 [Podospora australis]|uniref:YMC020W-like alpha/beta hydrolase domain-containing protein n=1 Tax=Podospora australis TaxID=1536484 RepID=A0AAN6WY73_9PEZI|nr:hypothetical protein QBC35DRAFT_490143 [Podospora australis]
MAPRKRAKPNSTAGGGGGSGKTGETPGSAPATNPTMSSPSQSSPSVSENTNPTPTPTVTPSSSSTTSTPPISIPNQRTPKGVKLDGSGDRASVLGPGSKQVNKTRSWYGSWPRKSSPSTHVARETIMGGTSKPTATADFSRYEMRKPSSSLSVEQSAQPVSSPLANIKGASINTGDGSQDAVSQETQETTKSETAPTEPISQSEDVDMKAAPDAQENTASSTEPGADKPAESQPSAESTAQRPVSTATWLGGWWGKANPELTVTQPATSPEAGVQDTTAIGAANPAPENKPSEHKPAEPALAKAGDTEDGSPKAPGVASEQSTVQDSSAANGGGSWFWYWPGGQSSVAPPEPAKEPEDTVMQDAPPVETNTAPPPPADPTPESAPDTASASTPKAGSTWAFWSRDSGSKSGKKPTAQQDDQGQLAVMGESSENRPKRTNSTELKDSPSKAPSVKSAKKEDSGKQAAAAVQPKTAASLKRTKRDRPESMDLDDAAPVRPSSPKSEPPLKAGPAAKTPTATKASQPNILLPSFSSTYKLKENPSIVKQIARLLVRGRRAPASHVYVTKDVPKIKKALAIGVHGLFPASYLRPMIGQPTGTSIKFANHTAEAIRRWADKNVCGDCEIEKVALEGEGKIGERVENLWKLLLNWIDQIRSADVIIIGCHSQGVPVSIMLLAKLIDMGVVNSARVGVCAMAGVSLGPFPDYKTGMGYLMGSAAELWAFADPQSEVSQRLEASLKAVLEYGARITFIGSIDDQLVPLESSIYTPAHHPYIFRAAFIDGRIHAPDFIAHLVGFALKLRNLGVSDHGLIRELSAPLAGSLYSGEGHSRLYDDEQVYDLAVSHALETTDIGGPVVPCEVHHRQQQSSPANPYHLPWIMRGLLEEDLVKTDLSEETAELVRQFDDWKPVTKALKDVKYRLEAVRSKL